MRNKSIKTRHWISYNILFFLEHVLGHQRMLKYFGNTRRNLDRKVDKYLSKSHPVFHDKQVITIEHPIDLQEFLKIRKEPVVFKGAAAEAICCTEWSFDFFKENYGDTEVLLNDNEGLIDYDTPQEFQKLLLKDYIDSVKSGSRKYLKFTRDIIGANPELMNHLPLKWLRSLWLPKSIREEVVMFLSGANTLTPTHGAPSSNFFIQVQGNKIWTMYPGSDRWFLDIRTDRTYYYYTKANPLKRDDPDFPLYKYATQYQVQLSPGDVLWVPPFYWHHVSNPTPSIGISYRFLSPLEAFSNSFSLMSLIFLATNPNPIVHMYTSIFHKRTAIFLESGKKNKS